MLVVCKYYLCTTPQQRCIYVACLLGMLCNACNQTDAVIILFYNVTRTPHNHPPPPREWRFPLHHRWPSMTSSNGNIFRSPVNSSHKGQWRGALMFSLICVWINGWVNNREAGDSRRYRTHYDVTVMQNVSYCMSYTFDAIWLFRH